MVGVRHLGEHPCPRCEVSANQLDQVGMKRDTQRRISLKRIDNLENRQAALLKARGANYDRLQLVYGAVVERELKGQSLTTSLVRLHCRLLVTIF